MENLPTPTLAWWRTQILNHGSNASCLQFRQIGFGWRTASRRCARLFLVTLSLVSVPVRGAVAEDGCSLCGTVEGVVSCDTCNPIPRLHGLGDGLLDHLDRATGHLEARLARLRDCRNSSSTPCHTGCDCNGDGLDPSMLSSVASQTIEFDQEFSQGATNASPVPVPMPDPIASPPSMHAKPVPAPKMQGNPFLDEARHVPKQGRRISDIDFGAAAEPAVVVSLPPPAPLKSTEFRVRQLGSTGLALSPSVVKQEVVVQKTSVKPAPKYQYRTPPERMLVKSPKGDVPSEVITAGSIQSQDAPPARFAR